jgi:hypothetical protein
MTEGTCDIDEFVTDFKPAAPLSHPNLIVIVGNPNSGKTLRRHAVRGSMRAMDNPAISAQVESLREEITIIRNQELFYQRRSHHCYEEIRAHARRELRLLDIQAALRRLLRDEPPSKAITMRIRNSNAHEMTEQ